LTRVKIKTKVVQLKLLRETFSKFLPSKSRKMREIVHLQAGQCGNQIGAKVRGNQFSSM